MTKVQGVDQRLNAAKARATDLKAQLDESTAKMARMKDGYERAVESDVGEAALDEMDAELFKSDREHTRLEIRLNQVGEEIEQLLVEREAAHREQEDELNRADKAAAREEAKELEGMVQHLVGKAAAHWQRVERIREHAKARGVTQIPFKISNLERRISAAFQGRSINKQFEQSYEQIFESNLMSVQRQMKGAAVEEGAETTKEA